MKLIYALTLKSLFYNTYKHRCSFLLLVLFGCASSTGISQTNNSFCVMELFTSEGCSSCPPADNMLNTAAAQAENSSATRLYIALHIEYWDGLGWVDPFGNGDFDQMFFDYYNGGNGISFNGSNQFGTPMFVRNGETGMNYSTQIQNKTATAWVDLSLNNLTGSQLLVDYSLSGDLADAQVRFFLVESDLTSNVTAGENNGLTLEHNNVARDMKIKTTSNSNGQVSFTIPADANLSNMRVMAYVRKQQSNPWSREIIGANKGFKVGEALGISEAENELKAQLFPNPANDFVSIQSEESIARVEIYNGVGELVQLHDVDSNQHTFDITELPTGLYLIKVVSANAQTTLRLIHN